MNRATVTRLMDPSPAHERLAYTRARFDTVADPLDTPLDAGASRDDREIEALVAAYASVIATAVRRVAGPRAPTLHDDVRQAVTVALWQQLARGQTIEYPASYIFRAAIRETIRLVRREQARAGVPLDVPEEVAAGPADDPHHRLVDKQRQRAVREALSGLAPGRRQAVRAHLAGFEVREIMEMFGWSYQTARHSIARGMADLRRVLRRRGIDAARDR